VAIEEGGVLVTDIEQAACDLVAAHHYRTYRLVQGRDADQAKRALIESSERLERLAMDFLTGEPPLQATVLESLAISYIAAGIHATVAEKINAPYKDAAIENQRIAFEDLTAEIIKMKEEKE
jgi:hypothetical protein